MRAPSLALAILLGTFLAPALAIAAPLDAQLELLRTRPTGMDEQEWRKLRRDAAREIGDSRDRRAVDALIEVAENERYDVLLSIAIEGLGKQGDPRALPALQKIHADRSVDTFIRDQAAEAISTLGDSPRDDARLISGDAGTHLGATGTSSGPQLGAMGAASAPDDVLPEPQRRRPLPENLVARDRALDLVMGSLDLSVNTAWAQQPVLADAGLGLVSRYVDERVQWGWSSRASLSATLRNGDYRVAATDNGEDLGNTFYIREELAGQIEGHYYLGKSDVHVFAGLGADQRLTILKVQDDGDDDARQEDTLSDTRFALDLAPAVGVGWGRNLNFGSAQRVEAIEGVLRDENLLARALDTQARHEIQAAIYAVANDRASYPRLAHTLRILQERGYLVRAPSPRVVFRILRVIEDPSYVNRLKGPLVRGSFVYGVPVAQDSYLLRNTDTAMAGPALSFDFGIQIDLEREIMLDTRVFYDALGGVTGISTNSGLSFRRYLHGRWSNYVGEWMVGLRGGISKRNWALAPDAPPEGMGYRGMLSAGYGYAFNRGSRIDVSVQGGVESGAILVGLGLGLRFGIGRGTYHVVESTSAPAAAKVEASGSAGE